MSTTCTITRTVRWRVRDWASCFYACRLRLVEDRDSSQGNGSKPILLCTTDKEPDTYRLPTKINKKTTHDNTCNQDKEWTLSSTESTINKAAEETSDSSWPHSVEEDYIVFCFKEDGAIHVIEDRRSEASHQINSANTSSKPVNRKLFYSENVEDAPSSSHGGMVNEDEKAKYPENEGDIQIMGKQGENTSDSEWPLDEIKEISHIEETNESKPEPIESTSSNLSDDSTSSFTFPVLGTDGMGSPVQMPKSENRKMKKPKERCVRLQCFRF